MKEQNECTEREIVIGLITSTEYCKSIRDFWDPAFMVSTTAKKLSQWAVSYFDEYRVAVNNEFENYFARKIKSASEKPDFIEELEHDILPSLSKQYEQGELNVQFLIDGTASYFRRRHWELFRDKCDSQKIPAEYKPLEIIEQKTISNYIWDIDQMEEHDREEPRLLLKPWLREGQFTFIYGDYGTGKSLLTIHLAYILGLEKYDSPDAEISDWQVKNPTGCLYVDGELGEVEFRERIRQFEWIGKQRDDIKLKVLPLPEYQLEKEDEFSLSERTNQLKIIAWLKANDNYKLLILDSVTTLFGLQEENSNSEWATKINPFLRDLRALGVAVILLHHAGKDNKRGLRGASAMGAMAHNIYCLTNSSQKDIDDGEAWFTITKNKQRAAGFSFKKFSIHYMQNSDYTSTEWQVQEGKEVKSEDFSTKEIRVIKDIINGTLKGKEIAERNALKPPRITQIKTKAKDKGYLTTDGKPTPLWTDFMERYNNQGMEYED